MKNPMAKKKMGPRMFAAIDRINAWLDESGMTQDQLADHIGLKQPSVNSFLRAKNGTSLENLAAIAEAFGRSLSDVFAETAPKPTKYSAVVTAWNALPNDRMRQSALKMMIEWTTAWRAENPPRR